MASAGRRRAFVWSCWEATSPELSSDWGGRDTSGTLRRGGSRPASQGGPEQPGGGAQSSGGAPALLFVPTGVPLRAAGTCFSLQVLGIFPGFRDEFPSIIRTCWTMGRLTCGGDGGDGTLGLPVGLWVILSTSFILFIVGSFFPL